MSLSVKKVKKEKKKDSKQTNKQINIENVISFTLSLVLFIGDIHDSLNGFTSGYPDLWRQTTILQYKDKYLQ